MTVAAKPSEYDTLWSYINWLNGGKIFLNRGGEWFSPEYPDNISVANFCNSGGVYVDYCPAPMNGDEGAFAWFLTYIGADPTWFDGWRRPATLGWDLCDPFKGYPYPNGWHTKKWLGDPNAKIYADWSAPTDKTACLFGDGYVYSVVGVRANNNGWYFYGFGTTSGESVNPQEFARFVKKMVGAAIIPSPQPAPQPVPSPAPTPAPGPTPAPTPVQCPEGTYRDPATGQCVSSTPVKKDYLLYVIAGGVIAGGIGIYLIVKGMR